MSGETQRRKYNPWSNKEREAFLRGLAEHGKDLRQISIIVQSKNYPQTRDYFYRMLKKVKSVLGSEIDHTALGQDTEELVLLFRTFLHQQDSPELRKELLRILNGYRTEKEEQMVSVTPPAVTFVPGKSISNDNPQALVGVGPLKLLVKLFPLNESTETEMKSKGLHPLLALSVGESKRLASIALHLNQKWAKLFGPNYSIRLYPRHLSTQHPGWGSETDQSVRVGNIIQEVYSSNNSVQLEYRILSPSLSADRILDCLNTLDSSYSNRNYNFNPNPNLPPPVDMNIYQTPLPPNMISSQVPTSLPPQVQVNVNDDGSTDEGLLSYSLPISSSSSDFAPSRDGFEGCNTFEGECRRFWSDNDRSLDNFPMTPDQPITPPKITRPSPPGERK